MYRRARKGELENFTGISSPFEAPLSPELRVLSGEQSVAQSLTLILDFLDHRFPDLTIPTGVHRAAHRSERKVAVIGLDCVPPSLVFGRAGEDLHNLRALMDHGFWGPLRSTDPPITIPAWTTMTTGRDPGELGIYGFRNRLDHDYRDMVVVNDSHVNSPRVWDYLESEGKRSILIGIPQTYPPRPHRGITVAGFPVPDVETAFTYPPELAAELTSLGGGAYLSDVTEFRTADKEQLIGDLRTMTERRFRAAARLLVREPWDFFMMVEIAPDRLHHAFWSHAARDHRSFRPGNPYENVLADFYRRLDMWVGSLLAVLDDRTTVMVVSDHGARTSKGGVCINDWLIRNGYLALRSSNGNGTRPFTPDLVDWSKTTAWSEGGYYARIFLNVKGREPNGTIEPENFSLVRRRLAERLGAMKGENGDSMVNSVLFPEQIYRTCSRVSPDLIVYFDDLSRRSIGSVGHDEIVISGNDQGPDGANHDPEGVFICARMSDLRRGMRKGLRIEGARCLDVTPTILAELGVAVPPDLAGEVIPQVADFQQRAEDSSLPAQPLPRSRADAANAEDGGFSPEEEEIVKNRLRELGYL